MAKPYWCKEAQAAPLHERGPSGPEQKMICYLTDKKYRKNTFKIYL